MTSEVTNIDTYRKRRKDDGDQVGFRCSCCGGEWFLTTVAVNHDGTLRARHAELLCVECQKGFDV